MENFLRNIKATISYKGTAYHGFQRQNNAVAVQNVIENTLSRLCNEPITVTGCSRTDTGVHAREFVFSFHTCSSIPCDNLVKGMNSLLPCDIAVHDCRDVPADFHARYSCLGKEYVYRIYTGKTPDPFLYGFAFFYPYDIDADNMNAAAMRFIGEHDFSAFRGASDADKNPVREIFSAGVSRSGDMVEFTVSGNGFLYNMVRIMTGTLLTEKSPQRIDSIIQSRNRQCAGITAPPCGLYLNRVFYGEEDTYGCNGHIAAEEKT